MVTPANRLHGMRALAGSMLGPGLGPVASGIGKAAKSAAGTGVHAAGQTFGKLADSVLQPLGERGLAGLTRIPRGTGQLGWRRENPAASSPPTTGAPTASGLLGRPLTGPESAMSKVKDWGDKLSTLGDLSQQQSLQLQDAMQKASQALQLLSNITKSMHETSQSVIRNMR